MKDKDKVGQAQVEGVRDLSSVRSWDVLAFEASEDNRKVHMGHEFGICVRKRPEYMGKVIQTANLKGGSSSKETRLKNDARRYGRPSRVLAGRRGSG